MYTVRTTQAFEDAHEFVAREPLPEVWGQLSVKQRLAGGQCVAVHVAKYPAGIELTEGTVPDLRTRCEVGSPGYPGWIEMGLVEVTANE